MSDDDQGLRRTQRALMDLESSLAALNRQKAGMHLDQYALMAEPIVDHIRRLRAEIDDMLEITGPAGSLVHSTDSSA